MNFRRYFTTLKLRYEPYNPSTVTVADSTPLLVLHGLFGSKQNWRSICKQVANKTARPILAVDLRNHGESPHAPMHGYEHMSADVLRLLDDLQIPCASILGHSMGGKVAMHMALQHPTRVDSMVSVDMPPTVFHLSSLFTSYLESMRLVETANVASQAEADKILRETIPETPIRQFILTNLKMDESTGRWKFRVNLDAIENALGSTGQDGIAGFPLSSETKAFQGRSLFIRGSQSRYVKDEDVPAIRRLFPNSSLVTVDGAGHWVHSEKPTEFIGIVSKFLMAKN